MPPESRCLEFDVSQPVSGASLGRSGLALDAAAAILVVSGTSITDAPLDDLGCFSDPETATEMGKIFGAIPGIVAKLCVVERRERRMVGGVHFFVDMGAVDTYLTTETWAWCRTYPAWDLESLSVEKFLIAA